MHYTDEYIGNLVDKYADMVYKIALHYVKLHADAEDIVQTVFLKIIKSEKEFDCEENEKSWIIRVCINCCKDFVKSAWKNKIDLTEKDITQDNADKNNYNDDTILQNYVSKLNSNQKSVVYLYYYEGYDVKSIADILSTRENTVMSWLHRARKSLKEMMKGEECFE